MKKYTGRIVEIDVIRGIAVILMVVFHFIVDLHDFYGYAIDYLHGFWYYWGKVSAILFIFIAGISCTFSKNNLKRGVIVLLWGMVITGVTFFYSREGYIRFGILHFLGSSMIIYHILRKLIPTAKSSFAVFLSGIACIIAGFYFHRIIVDTYLLLPFGLMYDNFFTLDYYPLFPWIGLFFFGVATGYQVYSEKKGLLKPSSGQLPLVFIGKHSLLIYLIHQPILLGLLYLYKLLQ